jgi:CheY-like chemotaxis protein
MRPKKKILLVGENEFTISILRFLLSNYGYAPTVAHTKKEARVCLADCEFDLLLCEKPMENTEVFFTEAKVQQPHMPIMMIRHVEEQSFSRIADAVCTKPTPAELLERIKIMAARKRGPRKGSIFAPRQAVLT